MWFTAHPISARFEAFNPRHGKPEPKPLLFRIRHFNYRFRILSGLRNLIDNYPSIPWFILFLFLAKPIQRLLLCIPLKPRRNIRRRPHLRPMSASLFRSSCIHSANFKRRRFLHREGLSWSSWLLQLFISSIFWPPWRRPTPKRDPPPFQAPTNNSPTSDSTTINPNTNPSPTLRHSLSQRRLTKIRPIRACKRLPSSINAPSTNHVLVTHSTSENTPLTSIHHGVFRHPQSPSHSIFLLICLSAAILLASTCPPTNPPLSHNPQEQFPCLLAIQAPNPPIVNSNHLTFSVIANLTLPLSTKSISFHINFGAGFASDNRADAHPTPPRNDIYLGLISPNASPGAALHSPQHQNLEYHLTTPLLSPPPQRLLKPQPPRQPKQPNHHILPLQPPTPPPTRHFPIPPTPRRITETPPLVQLSPQMSPHLPQLFFRATHRLTPIPRPSLRDPSLAPTLSTTLFESPWIHLQPIVNDARTIYVQYRTTTDPTTPSTP